MSDTVWVTKLPKCDFGPEEAKYDFRMSNGSWANGCEKHWKDRRMSDQLGTGHGQLLCVGEPPEHSDEEIASALQEALMAGDFDAAEEALGDRDIAEFM